MWYLIAKAVALGCMHRASSLLRRQYSSITLRRAMFSDDIEEAHKLAIQLNRNSYEDPATKYQVFTSKWLETKGSCCGVRCRHCPYGHFAVQPPNDRINLVQKSILINASRKKKELNSCDFMVYNGDKESIAMLVSYEQERRGAKGASTPLVLIALVEEATGTMIASKAHCYDIFDQCKQLGLPLCVLPCTETSDINTILEDGLASLEVEGKRNVYLPQGFPAITAHSADRFAYIRPSQRLDGAIHEQIQEIIKKETRYSIFGHY